MSNAVDRERERRDDTCPACGEDIDWEDERHFVDVVPFAWCAIERRHFDVAVLDMAQLQDS